MNLNGERLLSVLELGFTSYLFILVVHLMWAVYLLWRRLAPLGVGPIQHPVLILIGLLVLNGPSLFVFIEGSIFHSVNFAIAHAIYHIFLAFDEVVRVRRDPVRAVFLVNHLYWAALIYAFVYFDKFPQVQSVSTLKMAFELAGQIVGQSLGYL